MNVKFTQKINIEKVFLAADKNEVWETEWFHHVRFKTSSKSRHDYTNV